ncbi:MAG TPA: cytochrome C peroxidase, partial [Phaeodactylibacter sp.]|nr:cytochrome C peroxidase [Phaeodactylibacter sp.]
MPSKLNKQNPSTISSIFMKSSGVLLFLSLALLLFACRKNDPRGDLEHIAYAPTPYSLEVPAGFYPVEVPPDNPMTQEGIDLGRRLFYDPILSVDSTLSCSTCHLPEMSFTDGLAVSVGVGGAIGKRSSPSLMNVAILRNGFFWDGRVHSLEEQALLPIEDEQEMKADWADIEKRLQRHSTYPILFRKAFGISARADLDRNLVVKAIAQFERTLLSKGSTKFDRVQMGLDTFSYDEAIGYDLFFDVSPTVKDAECGNCHNVPIFT